MKQIRRRLIYEIKDSMQKQRAVAFAILLKELTNNSSLVRDFSINKVHQMTNMHAKTIRKYIDVLIKMGLVTIEGNTLRIASMTSNKKHRNLDISQFIIDKTKDIYNQIRDVLFLLIQAKKEYAKHVLRLRKCPTKDTDFKKVRRYCKQHYSDPDTEYTERGLSYKTIAKQMAFSIPTVMKIVKDTVRRGWVRKKVNTIYDYLPGVGCMEIPGYDFTTYNYGVKKRANTYQISKNWCSTLISDPLEYFTKKDVDYRNKERVKNQMQAVIDETVISIRNKQHSTSISNTHSCYCHEKNRMAAAIK